MPAAFTMQPPAPETTGDGQAREVKGRLMDQLWFTLKIDARWIKQAPSAVPSLP